MNYTLEKKDASVVVTIEITPEEWVKHTDEAYEKTKSGYQYPGFRKGHVPRKVLSNAYGARFLDEDALDICFPVYYAEALDSDKAIEVIDHPQLHDFRRNDDGSVTIVAEAPIKPIVMLGEYTGLTVEKADDKVSDAEAEVELQKILEKYSRMVAVDNRPVENGDEVTIDYSGSVNGEKFEGGTAEQQKLYIGSGQFIPGFEEQIIGMHVGEERDINVRFPDEYHADQLKGADSVFHIKLHKIEKKEIPELTDDFVKDISDLETADDYKNSVRKRLAADKVKRAEMLNENKLLEAIVENATIPESPVLIEREIDYYIADFETMLKNQGIKLSDYVKYTNQTTDMMRQEHRERAVKNVKSQLVIDAIIEKEKLSATPEQIEEFIAFMAKEEGKETEEFKKELQHGAYHYFARQATVKNFFNFIKENNKFE